MKVNQLYKILLSSLSRPQGLIFPSCLEDLGLFEHIWTYNTLDVCLESDACKREFMEGGCDIRSVTL
jgi:hypothetical protein